MCEAHCTDPLHFHQRPGARPRTSRTSPHMQLDQAAPIILQERLVTDCLGLPGVALGRSYVSTPTSRGFHIAKALRRGPMDAFLAAGEFGHIHGADDGSLHLALPVEQLEAIYQAGWGEPHPLVKVGIVPPTLAMIYAPRDNSDYGVVWSIVKQSYHFATQA